MIGKIISHYQITGKLGAGGMGIVYKAQDTTLGRTVALKFLPPYATDSEEDRVRFMNEAQAAAALDHPNLCTIHEISEVDGHHFIAMAFVDGQGLREMVSNGPLPVGTAVDIALQIASGLAAAHAHGIIHRDIKPANIIVGKNGVVKIVDFGLAKSSISKKLTRTGSTIGTAAYMSPEQARGEPVDQRTDIWSLGAVLYEMLTGQPPYSGAHEAMVMYAILHEDFTPISGLRPEIPAKLQHVVKRSLMKDVQKRYANMEEVIADLRGFDGLVATQPHAIPSRAITSKTIPTIEAPPRPRMRYLLPAAGALLLLVAAGTWFLLRPASHENPANVAASETTAPVAAVRDSAAPVAVPAPATTEVPAADSILPGIAILPFEGVRSGKDEESFAAGVTVDLISTLSGLRMIRVLPRQETMPYQGRGTAARSIGRALNADYVMQGTVQRDRDKLHLTTQLIKIADGSTVWDQRFDRDLKEIFQIQAEIAGGIAAALTVEISAPERKSFSRAPTANTEAYDYYLKGRLAIDLCTGDDNEQAEKLFRKAAALDKNYTLAQIGLAQTLLQRVESDIDPDPKWLDQAGTLLDKAAAADSTFAELPLGYSTLYRLRNATSKSVSAARRAVGLRPNDHETHFSLAVALYGALKWDEAEKEFSKILGLRADFGEPYIYRSRMAAFTGNAVAADSQLRKAADLAPRSPLVHLEAAQQLLRRGRFADAEVEARTAIQLTPQAPACIGLLGTVELWQGKLDDAINHLKKVGEDLQSAEIHRRLGMAYRLSGKKGLAEKALRNSLRFDTDNLSSDSTNVALAYRVLLGQCLLDSTFGYDPELTRLAKKSFRSPDPAERAYLTASLFCAVGKADRAVSSLRDALKHNTFSPAYVASDPAFTSLASNPKFRELVGSK